jgi:hypothetical protein
MAENWAHTLTKWIDKNHPLDKIDSDIGWIRRRRGIS